MGLYDALGHNELMLSIQHLSITSLNFVPGLYIKAWPQARGM